MTDTRQAARQKLQKAERIFASSPDAHALTIALLDISAALDDWFGLNVPRYRPRSRSYDIYNYREMPEYKARREPGPAPRLEDKLHQLCRKGVITRNECGHILYMRKKRNTGAHGGEPDVTYADVRWYCDLAGVIIGEPIRRESPVKNRVQPKPQKPASKRPMPLSPKQEPLASPPAVQHLPVPPLQPVASNPVQSSPTLSNDDFLAQLLAIELGGDK